MKKPGMKNLVMQSLRPDKYQGYIQVGIDPSEFEKALPYGIHVAINDHFELSSPLKSPSSAIEVTKILSEEWDRSIERGMKIAEQLVNLGAS